MPPPIVVVQRTSRVRQVRSNRPSRLSPAGWCLVSFAAFSATLFGMATSALVYWALFRLPQSPRLAAPLHAAAPVVAQFAAEGHLPVSGRPSSKDSKTSAPVGAFTGSAR
jgi:hypothetical protein